MSKEEIAKQRAALSRRPPLVQSNEIILVGVLLVTLQLVHGLTLGWLGTLGWWLGFVIGDVISGYMRRRRR